MSYGREVLLDIVDADPSTFTRGSIERYLIELCDALRLERADLHFWDYDDPEQRACAPAHLRGVTAVQFVTTSSVVVHALDESQQVLVNVFGCGEIDARLVCVISAAWFKGRVASMHSIERGRTCEQ